jgi:hypothetical protein
MDPSDMDPPRADPPGIGTEGPVPLAAIYILRDRTLPSQPGIEALSPLNAAQSLLIESYRPRLAMAMARRSRQVAITAAILNRNSVFRLTRPRGLELLCGTAAELRAHWLEMSGTTNRVGKIC